MMGKKSFQNKVSDCSELAKLAIRLWIELQAEHAFQLNVTVPKIMALYPKLNEYQARQVQHTAYNLGLLCKRENGRFYALKEPHIIQRVWRVRDKMLI